ncbi:tRNA (adenine-N1)-methyltransferase [Ignisphaera sp. 4213-co]|uniref:tRNA (Adenine-N1)-methyltransferase n=1 Tax=Ignisphaera cupida TaxID=3050454 RepID=A0ABD4Z812_9CREN|nr:tRNA (adenine-N1)-methyltransferase [Ignisphaera sp. 4213-co]MDK6029068.1 tRNA (adenine-N1)-methyltransferase [Ignisphaera sp. 4213-co]
MTPVLSQDNIFNYGDYVLIYLDRKRRILAKLEQNKRISSDKGVIIADNIVGKEKGSQIVTSLNIKAWALKPLLVDYIEKGIKRVTQVIYPKDLGFIIFMLGIESGARVLEAGVGSGNTTIVLAHFVKPTGHVYGYDNREDFLKIARNNIAKLGLENFVTLKYGDVRKGVDEKNLDAAVVDIPDPWEALNTIYNSLKPSAPVAFFIPSVQQLLKLYEALEDFKGFTDIRAFELILREYELSKTSIRPSTHIVGHTGFIMFARKIIKSL